MISVTAPDGTVVQFPEGTSDDKIKDVMRKNYGKAPKQRLRAAAQGLTLGFGDEAEAAIRSIVAGEPYEAALEDARKKLKAYQEDYPASSVGYEVAGAAAPAIASLIAAPFTGGSSTAAVAPTMARLALRGAVSGGIYGFGSGEGDIADRASRVPGGVVGGALLGPAAGVAVKGIGAGVNKLIDVARIKVGNRGSSVVESEIKRLVAQTGKTPDQIADDILNGRILAEDESIRAAVRAYRSGGGEPSRIIESGMRPRPEMTRARAMEELRAGLSPSGTPGALAERRASEAAARKAEKAAYEPFKSINVSDETSKILSDALARVPGAADEVITAFRATTGKAPFFDIVKDKVIFKRPPTVQEAEIIRRAIQNRASSLYSSSQGAAGEAVSDVEKALRKSLDEQVPGLASARLKAAGIRSERDAFEAGRKALTGDVNERLIEFSNISDPAMLSSYRAGLMSALEAKAATGSRQTLIRELASEESREGKILREVFPQDQLDSALAKLGVAKNTQAATQYVTGMSPTAETMLEAGKIGAPISASDIAGAYNLNPDSLLRVASTFVSRFNRNLTEAERARIARILVSTDAMAVRRALVDEGALAQLQQKTAKLFSAGQKSAAQAGGVVGAKPGAEVSQGFGLLGGR